MNQTQLELTSCKTAFLARVLLSETQALIITCLLSLSAPFITAINLLLCISLIKTKQAKRKSQRFILILGISDICVGAISAPVMAVTFSVFHKTRICWYEKLSLFLGHFNARLSAYVVFLIGLDRYFNIITDFRSESTLRKLTQSEMGHRAFFGIVLVATAAQGSLTVVEFENRSLPNSISSAIDAIIYLTYLFIYIRLYYKVRKFSKNNSLHLDPEGNNSRGYRPTYVRNLIKTVLYLLLSVGLCYLPYVIMKFTVTYIEYRLHKPVGQNLRFAHYLSFQPIIFNSFLNTVIILNRNSVLKKYVVSTISFWKKNQVGCQETAVGQRSASMLNEMTLETRRRISHMNSVRTLPIKRRKKGKNLQVHFSPGNEVLPVIKDVESRDDSDTTNSGHSPDKEQLSRQVKGCQSTLDRE